MIVYHGTDSISANQIIDGGIDFSKCNHYTDNAIGFYVTASEIFAYERAKQICGRKNISVQDEQIFNPVVVAFDFDETKAKQNCNCLEFNCTSVEWKSFVFANRLGENYFNKYIKLFQFYENNLDLKYDIVFDPTADSAIASVVDNFKHGSGKRTKEVIVKLISNIDVGSGNWSSQISFHTRKSLEYLSNPHLIIKE